MILLDPPQLVIKAQWLWKVTRGRYTKKRRYAECSERPLHSLNTMNFHQRSAPKSAKMLASRTLPPIPFLTPLSPPVPLPPLPSPPPVATFIHIPRRYVKSKMQSDRSRSESAMGGVQPSTRLRKSGRINDFRAASIASPVDRFRENEGPTSAPSSPKSARKRAVSLETSMNGTRFEDTDSPVDSDMPPHVCLCQPDPKVPRPRNAFILYRQHHQTAVAARNPGLANPDISKLIGEQWNAEGPDQKLIWQQLAQEEKAKHQEQYPDYRYQPRRAGKPGSLPQNPSGEHTTVDKYRCPKCGGRSIRTPTSPVPSARIPTLPSPILPDGLSPTARYLPAMSNLSLESPAYRRRGPGPSNLSNLQVPSPTHAEAASSYSPGTPDSNKRRRYHYNTTTNGRRGDSAYYAQGRRESLPPINALRPSPPNTAMLPPPPRTPRDARRGSLDLSVHVPDSHDQSRSVEAMIMSVPYWVKIKVLGRITPPLKDPGPTSPAVQVRGAIIAIEGDDIAAVEDLAQWLKDNLDTAGEYSARIAEPPRVPQQDSKNVSFEDYLDLIREWHRKTKEMIRYITTPVASSDSSDSDKEDRSDKDSDSKSPEIKKKPVVILPTYQLHAANLYTSRIPIQDAYSPTDHWQWMATLWRGTVGPDLTIYIDNPELKEGQKISKLVELNEEVRFLTVRKEKGAKFDPSALRRVGFEVGEWVRDVANKVR